MSRILSIYIALLLALIGVWLWLRASAIANFGHDPNWRIFFSMIMLHFGAHVVRMLRLVLLTLDERHKAVPLVAAHTLTAFPIGFLPFKLGEVFRLAAFFRVFEGRQKALAVWLTERLGDVLVITALIVGLYLFNFNVPAAMRTVFVLFALASGTFLVGLFAVTKTFVYLNRHLVLSSITSRGLFVLRISHVVRRLEAEVYKSVQGRITGFLLLSLLIWSFEILALSLYVNTLSVGDADFSALFISGLLASLYGSDDNSNIFDIYRPLALIAMTIFFLLAVWLAVRFKLLRF